MTETQERILELLESGSKIREACKTAGVRHVLHKQWLKSEPNYAAAVRKAKTTPDPTPEEIEERSAAIREKWTAARWAEYAPKPWRAVSCRSGLDFSPTPVDGDSPDHVEAPVDDDGD